ncbi:hypothetical protein THMIRHAM_00220 [Thiomicrorhabdus immobilis]|uniref:DUF5666 domain-containing protein n=1 Tax=Thiomicrorhabdus immobilis TaxID=2791037 RepID=A0ABM7MA81_9GAMM|nr:DUF5666 domain-containing protein [Thiomicrorhabdus immobilis]BCN92237.1 hypothetical protein THMIRHAM_00220 [Thiomicrorhabdus immobilis]
MLSLLQPSSRLMTQLFKNGLTILLLAMTVSACQLLPTEPSKPAETKMASNSGFGGTGKSPVDETQIATKSGFGGTGNVASTSGFGGTGIIGTITEFGSIWVNGVEIEYDSDVKISSNVSDQETLQLGQQVVVETETDKALPWTKNIYVFYPIAGKIEDVKANQIMVDGKLIYLNNQTQLSEGVELKTGHFVAISGYPDNNDNWVATRISSNPKAVHIYQLAPDVSFSDKVQHLLIEISKPQLSALNQSFKGLPIAIIETPGKTETSQKYLLKADIKKGEITQYHLLKHKAAAEELKKQSLLESSQAAKKKMNDFKEMHEMQKKQRDILQNQVEQARQIQELKAQFDNINEIKNNMFNNAR